MRVSVVWAFLAALAFVACGGKTDLLEDDAGVQDASLDVKPKKDATPDVAAPYQPLGKRCEATDAAAPPTWVPDDAGAPLRPPLAASSGGPVLAHPIFIPMTFEGDELRDPIEDFIASVGCTSYWHATATDYGVGDAVTGEAVHLTDKPPTSIDDTQIGAFIRAKIVAKTVPAPIADQTLYVIYYPDQTDITLQGSHSCQSFGGYHNNFNLSDGTRVAYAVIPRCGSFGQLDSIDAVTAVSSHELLEGSTDPYPFAKPAYQLTEPNGFAWEIAGGGEIADLCEFNDDAFFLPSDYPFYVQHSWSNQAAFTGQDPCQPTTHTYFAAAPVLPDTLVYDFGFGAQNAMGAQISVGNNKTIDVQLIASGPWPDVVSVSALDGAVFFGGKPTLKFSFDVAQGKIGDTLKLTVSRVGTNSTFGFEPFLIRASSKGISHSWWAVVGDP